jgi:2-polyprenyl-3-methyl-5-hydroxy-6-metoxy-1,4-benzoquinol methylase/uncharacterized protein YbaR (Trm112 family)
VREELATSLACPDCGSSLTLTAERRANGEVMDGSLRCRCGEGFPVRRGIPRLNRAMSGLAEVAEGFSHEWRAHHAGELERDTVFGRTPEDDWRHFIEGTGLCSDALAGARVLDVGCGSGSLTRQVAANGAGLVVALDMNEAVDELFKRARGQANLHVVQANLLALPFPERSFDVVWCCGVIHHTPDAAVAFAALTQQVRPGGLLYIWVYPRRFNPFRATKDVLEKVGLRRLSPREILRLAKVISYPSLALHWFYRLVRRLPGLQPRGAWAARTVKPRTLGEVQMSWNDALTPRYDSRHSEEEVIGWFRAAGFGDVTVLGEPRLGVRGTAPR